MAKMTIDLNFTVRFKRVAGALAFCAAYLVAPFLGIDWACSLGASVYMRFVKVSVT